MNALSSLNPYTLVNVVVFAKKGLTALTSPLTGVGLYGGSVLLELKRRMKLSQMALLALNWGWLVTFLQLGGLSVTPPLQEEWTPTNSASTDYYRSPSTA